jgi:hypothetical protein
VAFLSRKHRPGQYYTEIAQFKGQLSKVIPAPEYLIDFRLYSTLFKGIGQSKLQEGICKANSPNYQEIALWPHPLLVKGINHGEVILFLVET